MNLELYRKQVLDNVERIKQLGNWPGYIDAVESLASRVPVKGVTASGFDAGIACALDLIPRDKQKLSAILHAAYTPEAVEQVRKEIELIKTELEVYQKTPWAATLLDDYTDPPEYHQELLNALRSETCWWLAACRICNEGNCTEEVFLNQITSFKNCIENDAIRMACAMSCYDDMQKNYSVIGGVPVAVRDGGMQAAYISGHQFAVGFGYGIWMVGTYYPSLGIPDNFIWGTERDEYGRSKSGPIHGSKQFVKCSNLYELYRVVEIASSHLKAP